MFSFFKRNKPQPSTFTADTSHEGLILIPIHQTEIAMASGLGFDPKAKIEYGGYLVGIPDSGKKYADRLTHLALPGNMIGLQQRKDLLSQVGFDNYVKGILALDKNSNALGISLFMPQNPDGEIRDNQSKFVPMSQIELNKPLAEYFEPQVRSRVFRQENVTEEFLNGNGSETMWRETVFFPEAACDIGAIGTARALQTTGFTRKALAINKFNVGTDDNPHIVVGWTHRHDEYTPEQLKAMGEFFPRLTARIPHWTKRPSPGDMRLAFGSQFKFEELGYSQQEGLVGVAHFGHDGVTHSYFNFSDDFANEKNEKDYQELLDLTLIADQRESVDAFEKYIKLVDKYSGPRPYYAGDRIFKRPFR